VSTKAILQSLVDATAELNRCLLAANDAGIFLCVHVGKNVYEQDGEICYFPKVQLHVAPRDVLSSNTEPPARGKGAR
jgi:hypothetical protein